MHWLLGCLHLLSQLAPYAATQVQTTSTQQRWNTTEKSIAFPKAWNTAKNKGFTMGILSTRLKKRTFLSVCAMNNISKQNFWKKVEISSATCCGPCHCQKQAFIVINFKFRLHLGNGCLSWLSVKGRLCVKCMITPVMMVKFTLNSASLFGLCGVGIQFLFDRIGGTLGLWSGCLPLLVDLRVLLFSLCGIGLGLGFLWALGLAILVLFGVGLRLFLAVGG